MAVTFAEFKKWSDLLALIAGNALTYTVGPSGRFSTIQAAITQAAADQVLAGGASQTNRATVIVAPGVYAPFIASAFVDVIPLAGSQSTYIQATDATLVTLASNVVIGPFTYSLVTPTAARNMIIDNGAALTGVVLRAPVFSITTPAAFANIGLLLTGGSTVRMESPSASWAGSGASKIVSCTTAASTVTILQPDLVNNSSSLTSAVLSVAFAGCLITVYDGRATGTNSIHLQATAGVIRVHDTSYRSYARSGTGAIVDRSMFMAGKAPFHIVPLNSLQGVTLGATTSFIPTVVGTGTCSVQSDGQVLSVADNQAADVARVDKHADAANGLSGSFSATRTPNFKLKGSFNAFRADATVSFGLRQTVGSGQPNPAAESFAIWRWNGTILAAVVANATAETSATITTPSAGVELDFEILIIGGVQVEFYLGGALVATAVLTLPTGTLDMFILETTTGAGGATVQTLTAKEFGCAECVA